MMVARLACSWNEWMLSYLGVMMVHDTQCQDIWSQKNIYWTMCSCTPTLPDLIYIYGDQKKQMKIQLSKPWNSPHLIEFDRSWCTTLKFNIASMLCHFVWQWYLQLPCRYHDTILISGSAHVSCAKHGPWASVMHKFTVYLLLFWIVALHHLALWFYKFITWNTNLNLFWKMVESIKSLLKRHYASVVINSDTSGYRINWHVWSANKSIMRYIRM